jgi:hypothetical protein
VIPPSPSSSGGSGATGAAVAGEAVSPVARPLVAWAVVDRTAVTPGMAQKP